MSKYITFVQYKSSIRRPRGQSQILNGLGLRKLNQPRTLEDSPEVRGMINKIPHLVKIIN